MPVYDAGALSVAATNAQQLTFKNDTGTYSSADGGQHWQLTQTGAISGIMPPATAIATATPIGLKGRP